ncbi:MAG: FtsX-like permease family protein [Candidatus Hodarchaeota archaeon]
MFRIILFLAAGLGFLYVAVKNLIHILRKRKKVKQVQKAAKTKYSSTKSNVLGFGFRYARHYLRTHRKRAITLLFGFITMTTIATTSLLWNETAPYIILDQAQEKQSFPMVVRPFSHMVAQLVFNVQVDFRNNPLIDISKIVRQTVGLYGVEDKNNSFIWLNAPYVGEFNELFIIPEDYLGYVKNEFYVKGSLHVSESDVVISQRFVTKLERALNHEIGVGSYLNVTLGQRFPDLDAIPSETFLGDWDPYHLLNMRIAGIYSRKPLNPLISDSYSIDTLGDALFISETALPSAVLHKIAINGDIITTRLLIKLNQRELAKKGINNFKTAIRDLEAQIEDKYHWSVIVDTETGYLSSLVDTYTSSRPLISFLLLPPFFAAFLFIVFSFRVLYQDRKEELLILSSRGASLFQIYYGILMEFVILAVLGAVLGIFASIGNILLITGTKSFMNLNFNWILLENIFDIMLSKPWLCIVPSLVCSFVLILSLSYQIKNYLTLEERKDRKVAKRFQKWVTDKYLDVMALIGSYFLLVLAIPLGFLDFLLIDEAWFAAILVLVLSIWIGLVLISTKVQTKLGQPATHLLKPVLKNRSIFIFKNFQRRQSQILALGTILVLTGSICLFSFSYQTTIQSHTEKTVTISFGADLKIQTEPMPANEMINRFRNISEIIDITPVLNFLGFIGNRPLNVLGIVPQAYSAIIEGKISDSTLQHQWLESLDQMVTQFYPDGLIINNLIAQRNNITIGDTLTLTIQQEPREFRVIGILPVAPGFGKLAEDPESYTGNDYGTVFISAYSQIFSQSNGKMCLCKVKPEADLESLIYRLYEEIPEITQIHSREYDLTDIGFISIGTAGFLTSNFFLVLIILFLTLVLFFTHVIDQRRDEYAVMRVCGAKPRDLYKLISAEGVLIIGLSSALCTILGVTFGWIFSKFSLNYLPFYNVLPLSFEFPYYYLAPLVVLLILALAVGTIYPARRAQGQSITSILKNL